MSPIDEVLSNLRHISINKLRVILRKHIQISRKDDADRSKLEALFAQLPIETQEAVQLDINLMKGNWVNENGAQNNIVDTPNTSSGGQFMQPPSLQTINDCIKSFIDATGNEQLNTTICCSCARITNAQFIDIVSFSELPNTIHLKPLRTHPAHDIFFDGCLLHPKGVNGDTVSICKECARALKANKQPRHSLSNNMWIGEVPYELRGLSLPERIMIARHFPAAYIIKLFPKKKGARNWGRDGLHNALRGNVSTYKMDPAQLLKVIEGVEGTSINTYPPPANLLSAMIGVTFVGPSGVTEATLPDIFRVRRWKVRNALAWLKQNNPLYINIEISEDRLNALPEDGIPEEIMSTAKYSSDVGSLEKEREGYVPENEDEDISNEYHDQEADALLRAGLVEIECEDDENQDEVDPLTAPTQDFLMQSLGVVDIEGEEISSTEMMAHAMSNSGLSSSLDDYTIRRGSAFINEYGRTDTNGQRTDGGPSNANHLLGCFPTLFPYGQGGFEVYRLQDVPYETHVRWALRYEDKRFRKDYHFPYLVFGVCQKREVCRSAVLQMKTSTYHQQITSLASITPSDLVKASEEEARKVPFSNKAVRQLRDQLRAVRTRVKGTDESRQHVRSKIWGTNLIFNPPSLWITLNPADMQDPIAQVLAGIDIDLNAFCSLVGPTNTERSSNIANDPYASAEFFHLMIQTVLEELFGFVKKPNGRHLRKEGIVGRVQSYIGTVETQGRGSLHLHMLIWLQNAPTPKEMQESLRSPEFRDRIKKYISAVIKADLDGMTHTEILAMPKQIGVSYSRTDDPSTTSPEVIKETEKALVKALQLHSCSTNSCLKMIKGRYICKRRAPFDKAPDDWVKETGEWGPKRSGEYINNFNSAIIRTLRANHDMKLVLNGRLTAKLTFYITCYATKKQQRSSNASALIASSMAFKPKHNRKTKDLNKLNKRLIQRCANSLTRNREFSAPEVISYLMGWGDTYESHTFATIYWDSVIYALQRYWPELVVSTIAQPRGEDQPAVDAEQERPQTVRMEDNKLTMKDQLNEYQFRGDTLKDMNMLQFILDTYETDTKPIKQAADATAEDLDRPEAVKKGRPLHQRIPYKPEALKGKRCRMLRTDGHETLPRFIGRWFPRSDVLQDRELYCASMLVLLSPWTSMHDIKSDGETFEGNFRKMMQTADRRTTVFVENTQYYYECMDSAAADEEITSRQGWQQGNDINLSNGISDEMGYDNNEESVQDERITELDIEAARFSQQNPREVANAEAAIDDAFTAGIFDDCDGDTVPQPKEKRATADDMNHILKWDKFLKATTRAMVDTRGVVDLSADKEIEPEAAIGENETAPKEVQPQATSRSDPSDSIQSRPKRDMLNREQRRAHDMVEERLISHIAGKKKQLLMLVLGQGGTGKSMLIGAITETFRFHGQEHILAKCATTGIAASDIGGQTLHSWAALSIARKDNTDIFTGSGSGPATDSKRMKNIEGKDFLILDEASMADKVIVFSTSQVIVKTKGLEGTGNAEEPFGGMTVIMSGDFHQFPPVQKPYGALYVSGHPKDSREAILGREIFLQFDKVIILKQQNRATDQGWIEILDRLRIGQCTEDDITEIKKLVLTNPECNRPNFKEHPWNTAILVTPRHSVREKWNQYALIKHCKLNNVTRYIAPAEDAEKGSETLSMEARLATACMGDKKTGKLPHQIEIAVGMKAMVLVNLAVEADIANGTRGTVEDIILDSREADEDLEPADDGTITLRYPPALILFRPDKPTKLQFEGIKEGLIPIAPSKSTFTAVGKQGQKYKMTRKQYALTPGYAFTDYKSQGQTIEYVIIDIAKPAYGTLSPFSTYVALSRSRGRETIRLLRDFDEQLFQKHPSDELERDMTRIVALDRNTETEWEARKL